MKQANISNRERIIDSPNIIFATKMKRIKFAVSPNIAV